MDESNQLVNSLICTSTSSFNSIGDSREEHQLIDRRSTKEFAEGVDEEVIGQQAQLNQQHQGVVASLKHGGPVVPQEVFLSGFGIRTDQSRLLQGFSSSPWSTSLPPRRLRSVL